MNLKNIFLGMTTLLLVACGRSDAEIKNDITEEFKLYKGVNFDVKEGIVTISSKPTDEDFKQYIQRKVEKIKGVKSVVNNCQVFHPKEEKENKESHIPLPPPPPSQKSNPKPVDTKFDYELNVAIGNVVMDYAGVNATVYDYTVELTGPIKKEQLPELIKRIKDLTQKKIVNKLIVR